MFTSLPECLVGVIVSEWIDLGDICRLDSAFCAHDFRPELLSTLSSQAISRADINQHAIMVWMILRRIRVESVSICDVYNLSLGTKFFATCGNRIRYLQIMKYCPYMEVAVAWCFNLTEFLCRSANEDQVARLLANNPKLKKLVITIDKPDLNTLDIVPSLNLTVLSVHMHADSNSTFTGNLISRAPNLLRVSIRHEYSQQLAAPITSNCVHLKCLQLDSIQQTDKQLSSIVALCPNIVHLDLLCCSDLTDAGVMIVAQHLQFLRSLGLQRCNKLTDLSLQHLLLHCADKLELLQLKNNTFITREGMDHFRQHCTNLRTFRFIDNQYRTHMLLPRKATVIVADYHFIGEFVRNHLVKCDNVEILHQQYSSGRPLSADTLTTVCAYFPRLHTLVVLRDIFEKTKEAARGLPQLTVTTDKFTYSYDVMSMPI